MAPGERTLWQGQPIQGLRFTPADLFAIPFALLWLLIVLSIFSTIFLGRTNEVQPMSYVVLPLFLLVGLHMLAGRLIVDRFARRKTRYTLTNRRAIIESGLLRPNCRSLNLSAVPEIRLRRERDGRGTIQFGAPSPFGFGIPQGWPGASQFLPPAFEGIEQAERVYQQVLSVQGRGPSQERVSG